MVRSCVTVMDTVSRELNPSCHKVVNVMEIHFIILYGCSI